MWFGSWDGQSSGPGGTPTPSGPLVCGVPNQGTKPGDPDNISILTATSAFGGIDVNWTYPATNPHAVSYTKLYRGVTANFAGAALLVEIGGGHFFDKSDSPTEYFYWIQFVSVNGTIGNVIGPASATARTALSDMIAYLTGQIDSGLLALSLKQDIEKITSTYSELQAEIQARIAAGTALSQAISDVDDVAQQTLAYIGTEMTTRADGDAALASQINTVAAMNDTTAALVQEEHTAWVTATEALAVSIEEVAAASGGGSAAVIDAMYARVGYSALNNGFSTPFDGDNITTVYPVGTYPTAEYPQYAVDRKRIIDKVGVDNWNATAAGILKPAIWVAGLPLATAVKQVGVTGPDGSGVSLEQAFTAQKDLNNSFKGLYTVKVSITDGATKLIGGFGLYGDSTGIEAGFDVDRFWIGRTAANKMKPFIISGGVVYISQAVIPILTSDKINGQNLRVMSGGYGDYNWPVPGQEGFYLGPEGLRIGNINNGRYVSIEANGNILMPGFNVINGTATFAGNLNGASGTFSGSLTASAINAVNTLNIQGDAVTVPRFAMASGIYITQSTPTTVLTAPSISVDRGDGTAGSVIITASTSVLIPYSEDVNGVRTTTDVVVAGVYRNGVSLGQVELISSFAPGVGTTYSSTFADSPGIGTHTYVIKMHGNAPTNTSYCQNVQLILLGAKK